MKIALTATGTDLNAQLDQRFGRASQFILYDTESSNFSVVDNEQNLNAPQGAGIQAAQNVINTGAEAVITGHTGPKAFKLLSQSDVKIYYTNAQTVQNALDLYKNGKLQCADTADVEGHWI